MPTNPHALKAKVHGLKGNLLNLADYQILLNAGPDIAQVLASYKPYAYLLKEGAYTGGLIFSQRATLQNALHLSLHNDKTKLKHLGFRPPKAPLHIKEKFKTNPTTFAMGYLSLKKAEIKNITTIIEAAAYKRTLADIKEVLIL